MDTQAERLKRSRLDKGMSQQELADKAGVKQSTIGNIESGIRNFGLSVFSIANVLGVSATWLKDNIGDRYAVSPLHPNIKSTPVEASKFKYVYVVGKGSGGILEERLWTDGDYPTDGLTEYAEVASSDPNAFIVEVIGDSMSPRYQPGEYALVEPNCEPEIEDDVLIRLTNGQTMIKRLLARRSGIKLGSYNNQEILSYKPEEVSWIYYVAYPVPARKIRSRT